MYTYESRIGFSECDNTGKLTLTGLLNYFQDVATFQSEDLGVGWAYIHEHDMVWVLSSWQIVVNRYPNGGEWVTVGTYPYDFRGCFGYRNFVLQTRDGERLAVANSLWTLLNIKKGGIGRLTDKMQEVYVKEPKLEMNYKDRRIAVPADGEQRESYTIMRHHLDTNNHVNNGQYVELARQEIPMDFVISEMRAEYKKQAFLDDVIHPFVAKQEDGYIVALRNESSEDFAVIAFSGGE